MTTTPDKLAFWRVPVLILAAIIGVIGLGASAKLELGSNNPAGLLVVPWACAGACLTLVFADAIHHGRMNMARFQITLLGVSVLLAHLFILYAVAGVGILLLAWFAGALISELF